jgi:hypothetical protein
MVDKASRRGAVDPGVLLMVAAFAVIGFFLYWLQGQAAEERAVSIVEDTTSTAGTVDTGAGSATAITPADIQAGADTFVGQTVRLASMQVAGTLGQQGFWLDLPTGPFLVALSSSMIADSTRVSPGSTVTVTGTMTAMNDSVTTSWFEAGRIGEGDQLAASFASHFIEASRIETAPGGGGR